MKVKELIELLQKENPEDEIHIWVDDEVGCGAGEFSRYYATDIKINGHDVYYQSEDDILNEKQIEEYLLENYNFPDWDESDSVARVYDEINSRKKLEGCWITIQP